MMLQFIASIALASTASAGDLASSLPSEAEVAEPGIVRVYDLTATIPTFPDGGSERVLPQLVMDRGGEGFWFPKKKAEKTAEEQEGEETESATVIDFLVSAFGEEAELEGRLVEPWSETSVIVKGPEEFHARFRAVLAAAEAMFSSAASIRVDVFKLPERETFELPTNGVMPIERWEALSKKLVSGGAHRESVTLSLEEGRTARADHSRYYEFVAGYDVEIAASSFISDPLLGTGRVGTRISAQGSPLRGGLALALSVQSTSLAGEPAVKSISTGGILGSATAGSDHVRYTTNVIVPNLSTRVFAADAFLPDGHVLLFGGATDLRSGHGVELVVVRRLDAAPPRGGWIEVPGTDRRYLVVAAGAVAPPAVRIDSKMLWSESPGGTLIGWIPHRRSRTEGLGTTVEFPSEWDWLTELVNLGADTENAIGWSIGPWVIVGGEGGAVSRLSGPEAFNLADAEPLTVDLALSDGDGGRPVTTRVSMRVGGQALAVLGYERTAIPTYDVEVAQFAACADPSEYLLFDGMVVRLAASRGANGALHLEVKVRSSLERGEASTMRLEGFEDLVVDTYDHEQFFADGRFVLEPGQDGGLFTLGGQPGDGTPALSIQVH